jgi:hypothetical protein
MPRRQQLEGAVGRQPGLDAVDQRREAGPRLKDVQLGGRLDGALQIEAAMAQRIAQRQEDPPDLFDLLLLERDDVVVDLDSAERLQKQAGAAGRCAVDDAGNRAAVLCLDDQNVPAVPLGDDLLLQVLGGVLAPEVRLQRAPQPRALLAEPFTDQPQLGARAVDDLARRLDLLANLAGLALERRGVAGGGFERGKRSSGAPDAGARFVDRIEKIRERDQAKRLERPTLDGERVEDLRQFGRRAQREQRVDLEIASRLGGGREQLRDVRRVDRRFEPAEAVRAHRREREAPDGLDDPVEFESSQSSRLHKMNAGRAAAQKAGNPEV